MNSKKSYLKIVSGLLACGMAISAQADSGIMDDLNKAVSEGSVKFDFRYRLETVDQDGASDDATASTLRSRITFSSGTVKGFSAVAEVDNVSFLGNDSFNSTENGRTQYPVVADPDGTEVNQAYIKYTQGNASGAYGRQRILHASQRFIGGVGWRQNEQTYDAFRAQWKGDNGVSLDYAYVYNVNRIFGPEKGPAQPPNLSGDNHFVRIDWKAAENHSLAGYIYALDVNEQLGYAAGKSIGNSSNTYGLEYSGKLGPVMAKAAWATQSDGGDSALNYDADYMMVEGAVKLGGIKATVGYEVLGAGDGVGFKTPFATLHKFQGWADKFLVTPGDGIEDLYFGLAGKAGPVKLAAIYHDFQAEDSSEDFGNEIDLVATLPINKQFTVQLKYAGFSSDSTRYADTDKLWFTLQLKL